MLKRIFAGLIPGIDRAIEKIPPHIRDIIQKASLAFAALLALLVIIAGVNKGLRDAKPKGFQAIESNRDIFYLQEMREEYAKKRKLVEDVEVDPLEFPSRQVVKEDTPFVPMGRDTINHLMGEKDEALEHDNPLRPREKSPGYLGDSMSIPQRTPDKKTIDEDDHLTKDKIQNKPLTLPQVALPTEKKSEISIPSKAIPQRDVFDEGDSPQKAPVEKSKPMPPRASNKKMEYIE